MARGEDASAPAVLQSRPEPVSRGAGGGGQGRLCCSLRVGAGSTAQRGVGSAGGRMSTAGHS